MANRGTGLGNISETYWSQVAYAEVQKRFGFFKRRTQTGALGLNYLCSGMKQFYWHLQHQMPRIIRRVKESWR